MARSSLFNPSDRRTFLKYLSLAGVTGLINPRKLLAFSPDANSRVIIVDDTAATSGNSINSSVVRAMVNSGITTLAQAPTVSDAWKVLLPGVTSSSKIALKVNCINSGMSTHPAVTNAVVNALKLMTFSGIRFPENNIIVFDRTTWELQSAGYTINTSASGVRCFGTDSSGIGYSTQNYAVAGQSQRLSKIITDTTDFLINIAVLKNHGGAGVTLCLKNHFGTCNNPGALHGNYCDPYAATLSSLVPIMAKQKVNIIDALFGIRSGGPSGYPQFSANKIIMSTDIVAADYQGRKLLKDNGCTNTGDAGHIDTAATMYSLGTNDPTKMDIVTVSSPSSSSIGGEPLPSSLALNQNYPNPFNAVTHIRFSVPRSGEVEIDVVDTNGRVLATLVHGNMRAGEHTVSFVADQFASGVYFYRLKTETAFLSHKMILLK